jgi:hypothetical protein
VLPVAEVLAAAEVLPVLVTARIGGNVSTTALLSRPYAAPAPKTAAGPIAAANGPSMAYPITPMPYVETC